ncbi:MAG: hypothetical protein CSA58_10600 [Micrococcales bacterium]|nr:MAG: hypothetical protein CSA58_10600 [Micrococcales bacterium]
MIVTVIVLAGHGAEEGGHHIVNELPMTPVTYGLIAAAFFTVALLATVAFRSIGHRHAPQAFRHQGGSH